MYSLYCGFVHLICLFIWFALFKWFLSHSASRLTVQYRIPPYPAMCVLTSLQGLVTLYLKLTSILLFDVVAVNISVLKENCLEMEKFDEGDLKENVGIAEDLMVSTRVFTNILTDFLHDLEVSVPSIPSHVSCLHPAVLHPTTGLIPAALHVWVWRFHQRCGCDWASCVVWRISLQKQI